MVASNSKLSYGTADGDKMSYGTADGDRAFVGLQDKKVKDGKKVRDRAFFSKFMKKNIKNRSKSPSHCHI